MGTLRHSDGEGAEFPEEWVIALFKKFRVMYGTRWTGIIDGIEEQAVEEWRRRLSGVTGDAVSEALQMVDPSWPPTPMEFAQLCWDAMTDYPSPEAAWAIVCDSRPGDERHLEARWRHPLVMHAARDERLDLYALRRLPAEKAIRAWTPVYLEYARRLKSGEVFEFPAGAIEDKTEKPVTPEERTAARERAMEHLLKIKEMISE